MSRYRGNGDECPTCGITYKRLQTGMTYRVVFELLIDNHSDSSLWRYKRRSTVLGMWHQIKRELWKYHIEVECPKAKAYEDEQRGDAAGGGVDGAAYDIARAAGSIPF